MQQHVIGIPDIKEGVFNTVDAQELACGDWFKFRGTLYCALAVMTDVRHTLTKVICIAKDDDNVSPRVITALRLFRTAPIDVYQHSHIRLDVIDMTAAEISKDAQAKLQAQRLADEQGGGMLEVRV